MDSLATSIFGTTGNQNVIMTRRQTRLRSVTEDVPDLQQTIHVTAAETFAPGDEDSENDQTVLEQNVDTGIEQLQLQNHPAAHTNQIPTATIEQERLQNETARNTTELTPEASLIEENRLLVEEQEETQRLIEEERLQAEELREMNRRLEITRAQRARQLAAQTNLERRERIERNRVSLSQVNSGIEEEESEVRRADNLSYNLQRYQQSEEQFQGAAAQIRNNSDQAPANSWSSRAGQRHGIRTHVRSDNSPPRHRSSDADGSTKTLQFFSGKAEEDLDEWKFEMERYFQKSGIRNHRKVDFSVDYLRGSAKLFYRRIPQVELLDWDEFYQLLRQNYEPQNKQIHYRNKLESLKQTGAIEEYIRQFDQIAVKIRDMSQYDLTRSFIRNLKPRTRELVDASDTQNIYDAKAKALRIDTNESNNIRQPSANSINTSNNNNYIHNNNSTSSRYNNRQHQTNTQRQPVPQSTQIDTRHEPKREREMDNKCWYCGLQWHKGHRCVKGSAQANISYSHIIDKLKNVQIETVTTLQPEKNNKRLIRVYGYLVGHEINCIIDTGATDSIISKSIADKLNLEPSGKMTPISLADGSMANANSTMDVEFSLAGKSCKMPFLITEITAGDALIGIDWLTAHNAWIHASKRLLVFLPDSTKMSLNLEFEEKDAKQAYAHSAAAQDTRIYMPERTFDDDFMDEIEWPEEQNPIFYVPVDLEESIRARLVQFLKANISSFAKGHCDLGTCTVEKLIIDTGDHKPIFNKPFPVSDKQLPRLKKAIDEMLEAGVIIPAGASNWAAPCHFVKKDNDEFRFVLSYVGLNKITKADHFPIPNISHLLNRLKASKYYTRIDLKSGFWQVKVDEDSIDKTTFIVPWGTYKCLRMPFGLKNNPSIFSRIMYKILGHLDFVEIYIDDIIIHSGSIDEHFDHIYQVLVLLKKANLKLNAKKSVWFKTEITLLGHTVTSVGIRMDKSKINAVLNFPIPASIKDLLSFLGLTGYYRIFVENYAKLASPLFESIKQRHKEIREQKDTNVKISAMKKGDMKKVNRSKLVWTQAMDKAFKILQQKLCEDPILVHFNPCLPVVGHSDASNEATGGIICQKKDKHYQVVAYTSQAFSDSEKTLTTSEQEFLGICRLVKKFHPFLVGSPFKVYTDHIALVSAFKLKDPHGKLMRMRLLLQTYQMEILFRSGKCNQNVDTLSRLISLNFEPLEVEPLQIDFNNIVGASAIACSATQQEDQMRDDSDEKETAGNQIVDSTDLPIDEPATDDPTEPINDGDIFTDPHLLHYVKRGKHLAATTTKQAERTEKMAKHYVYLNPNIYYRAKVTSQVFPFIVPPPEIRAELIEVAHGFGHFAKKTTKDRIRERYSWPKMAEAINSHIDKCHSCIRHDPKPELHHQAHAIRVKSVGDTISIDLIGPIVESKRGNKYICTITEYVTKNAFARPIKNKTAESVAEVLWQYISIYGPPRTLLSDQGTEFVNHVVRQLTLMCGINHRVTSPYHPNTNGLVERFNQTLIRALKKHCEDDPEYWCIWIPFILLAYNCRKHSTTGYSPYGLMYGRIMNHFENYIPNEQLSIEKRVQEIKEQYDSLVEDAKRNITKKQVQQIATQDGHRKVTTERMPDGQLVTIKSLKLAGKLQPKYHGVYKIIGGTKHGNYRLESMTGVELKQSFVPERLKKLPDDIEENDPNAHFEIEEIIKHRKRAKKYEYLVRWKNHSEEENTWEPESSFDTIQCIEEYWSNKNKSPKDNKSPKANLASGFFSSMFQTVNALLIISALIPGSDGILIKDAFKYCEIHDNKAIWAMPESCRTENVPIQNIQSEYYALTKLTNEVDGRGWFCTMQHRTAQTHLSWSLKQEIFGQFSETRELTQEDCAEMIRTKKCGQIHMTCENDYCISKEQPELVYSFWSTTSQEWSECEAYAQTVEAETSVSRILTHEHMLTSCTPKDLYCKFPHGILIWSADIIKECPYELAKSVTLQSYGNILVSEGENKLFQVTKNTTICDDIKGWETAEGFFLTQNARSLKLKTAENALRVIDELILSEIDYQKMSIMKLVTHLNNLQNIKLCQLYKSFMNLYSKTQDEFFTFSDFNGNEAILYSNEGQIFIPKCIRIEQVQLIPTTKKCYRDIPIKMMFKDNTMGNVFLTGERIIRTTSTIVSCKNNFNSVHLPYSQRIVIMRENRTSVSDDSQYKHITINLQHANVTSFNFHHDEKIITSVNIVKKAAKVSAVSEGQHGQFHVKENYQSDIRNDLDGLLTRLDSSIWTTIENKCRTVASYAGSVGFIVLFLFLTRGLIQRRKYNQTQDAQKL